jgi:hypothetical protein
MKNKQMIYVLLPLVLIIWGFIAFKIIRQVKHKQNPPQDNQAIQKASSMESVKDTFSLILEYRDPFLHGMLRPPSISSTNPNNLLSNKTNLSSETKPVVVVPNTKYFGLVTNSKNKQKLALIKINEKDYIAKEGEVVAEEKISKLFADSMIILYHKTKKTIPKNK